MPLNSWIDPPGDDFGGGGGGLPCRTLPAMNPSNFILDAVRFRDCSEGFLMGDPEFECVITPISASGAAGSQILLNYIPVSASQADNGHVVHLNRGINAGYWGTWNKNTHVAHHFQWFERDGGPTGSISIGISGTTYGMTLTAGFAIAMKNDDDVLTAATAAITDPKGCAHTQIYATGNNPEFWLSFNHN